MTPELWLTLGGIVAFPFLACSSKGDNGGGGADGLIGPELDAVIDIEVERELERVVRHPTGVLEQDAREALRWYRTAAAGGDGQAAARAKLLAEQTRL